MQDFGLLSWLLLGLCFIISVLLLKDNKLKVKNMGLLSPKLFFGIAFLLMNVLPPFNTFLTGRTYRGFVLVRETNLMLVASALSGLSFLAGWKFHNKTNRTRSLRTDCGRVPSYYLVRALFLLPIMIWAVNSYLREIRQTELMVIYIFEMAAFAAGCILLALAASNTSSRPIRYVYLGVCLLLSIVYIWLAANQGSRLMFMLIILPLLAIGLSRLKRFGPPLFAVAGAMFLIFFVFYGKARLSILTTSYSNIQEFKEYIPRSISDVYERLYLQGDLDAFENGSFVMRLIPSISDYYYGSTFATLFVLPIPRIWWPTKPSASVNGLLANHFNFSNENFAISLQAETYANFSWPGIILLFFLFGHISKLMLRRTLLSFNNSEKWSILGLYSAYVMLVMRGSFHSMTSYFLMVLFWLIGSRGVCSIIRLPKKELRKYIH